MFVSSYPKCTLLFVLTATLFRQLLKYLPQTTVAWGDVWLGAAVTAALWMILQIGIGYYIALSGYSDYGVVGGVLALIAWVYLSSQALFLGGEFTNCYARRYGSRASENASAVFDEHPPQDVPVSS